jgi:hypothetical protein
MEPKLLEEDTLMDAICTLDSTLVFHYGTKLPELRFRGVDTVYTRHLRKTITSIKDTIYANLMNSLYCISNQVMANLWGQLVSNESRGPEDIIKVERSNGIVH